MYIYWIIHSPLQSIHPLSSLGCLVSSFYFIKLSFLLIGISKRCVLLSVLIFLNLMPFWNSISFYFQFHGGLHFSSSYCFTLVNIKVISPPWNCQVVGVKWFYFSIFLRSAKLDFNCIHYCLFYPKNNMK